ncbi:hypothetical protein CEUSTIGMA_g8599.t1, partial [Chlamydomonas eustigma]
LRLRPLRSVPAPPPPPPPKSNFQMPNRRDALFTLLGAAIGGGGAVTYYNTQYDLSETSAEAALDRIFSDPDLLDAVAEEALYRNFESGIDDATEEVQNFRELEAELDTLERTLSEAAAELGISEEELRAAEAAAENKQQ